jgi:hypothetical protein
MRADLTLLFTMFNRALIILIAASCLVLPFLTASVQAGGCCGATPDHKGAAADNATPRKCCCGDATACGCHLTGDDATPSAELAPVPTEPDRRACLMGPCTVSPESIVPYQDQSFTLTPFTHARAPASEIHVLNHTFIC